VPIDDRHLRLGMPEGLRRGHAPKAAPDDRHPRDVMSPVTHLETIIPCRRGASLPWGAIGWKPPGRLLSAAQDFAVLRLPSCLKSSSVSVEKSFVKVSVTGSPSMVWYANDISIDKSSNA
jgi:hypothetical protein